VLKYANLEFKYSMFRSGLHFSYNFLLLRIDWYCIKRSAVSHFVV